MTAFDPELLAAAQTSAAWPFEEARKLVARVEKTGKQEVLFETGYGPSGLPHIGTFGEVARTSMVRHAFRVLTEDRIKTRLIAFSDDMDGLRKVPDNVPNREMMATHLGKPLSRVPDPFSNEYPSFGAANNARLCAFLDRFGFDYEFVSATETYTSGRFDAALLHMLAHYEEVRGIILPTLGEERRKTYSPFLPLHPRTGIVMQVPTLARDVAAGTISWADPDTGETFVTPVTGGHVKCQWKADWALRWYALGIDYEMSGKDLIDSVTLSSRICRALGAPPPEGFNYELFLDEAGQKISKSKGNGLTIEDWLSYGSPESLAQFMYAKPREAKRLHFDVIPRCIDDYQQFLAGYARQDWKNRLGNPVWHIHAGAPPAPEMVGEGAAATQVSFSLLMNLVAVANAESKDVLWGFLRRYAPEASPERNPKLDALVGYAIAYFRDFVKPKKTYRAATPVEAEALSDLAERLGALAAKGETDPARVQDAVYDSGRRAPYLTVNKDGSPGVSGAWFNTLYEILLGEPKGPRFGSFAAIYGLENTRALIARALSGALIAEHEAFMASRRPQTSS